VALAAALLATAPQAGAASLGTGARQPHAASRPLTGAGVAFDATPSVWNGTDLVTTQIDPNGNLYAYEQVPGAASWKKETVETAAANGGAQFDPPSITAAGPAVQIVAADTNGNIWFFQQTDGQTTWSAAQLVGSVGENTGTHEPQIAWTGVPGHTGTNSVITLAQGGNVLFWYQNGGGWSQEKVATGSEQNGYYDPAITATDKGIVIVAPGTSGAFFSFYQPYGGSGWVSDGSVGAGSNQYFSYVSATWDGVNVDVVAAFNSGFNDIIADKLVFLWKSDSARNWTDEDITGPTSTQPLDYTPAIAWTGSNLIVTAVQQMSSSSQRIDFWWQGSTFTNFNFEKVATSASPTVFYPSTLVSTHDATSSGEIAIFAPVTTNNVTAALDDWTQPTGEQGWTKHTVTPA
jgi:hypothetical protein